MALDPKLIQWIASVLLVLSGVQGLVGVGAHRSGGAVRAFGALISLASAVFGVYMIVTLLGAKV
jgi:hypothetical protein